MSEGKDKTEKGPYSWWHSGATAASGTFVVTGPGLKEHTQTARQASERVAELNNAHAEGISPPPLALPLSPRPESPTYYASVGSERDGHPFRYEAGAPSAQEALDLLYTIQAGRPGYPTARKCTANELRQVLNTLVTEANAKHACFSCGANAGHFNDCPVKKAQDLLEGYPT